MVDTVNFKQGSWLDPSGVPRGAQTRIVERIRPLDGGKRLEIQTTVTDADLFETPWTTPKLYDLRPGAMLEDFVCVDRVRANPRWASTDGAIAQ